MRGSLQPDSTPGRRFCLLLGPGAPAMPQTSSSAIKVSRKVFPQRPRGLSQGMCECVHTGTVEQEPQAACTLSHDAAGPGIGGGVCPGLGGGGMGLLLDPGPGLCNAGTLSQLEGLGHSCTHIHTCTHVDTLCR